MKSLILSAGYATRLYPLTFHMPKSLLKLNGKTVLDYIIEQIERLEAIEEIIIISNDKFYAQFENWLALKTNGLSKPIRLINDGSTTVENRLGAIADIKLAIEQLKINDDLLIVAGDNLFDFALRQFIEFSATRAPHHSICLYSANNGIDLTRFGIAQLNGSYEIVNFEEKPDLPKSNLIATCIYFFPKEKLHLIADYLSQGHHSDTPGSYIRWLTQNDKVYGHICDGIWFDLGDFDSLSAAIINFRANGHKDNKQLVLGW